MTTGYQRDYLKVAHKHSSLHKKEVLQSDLCGCFYCLKTFKSDEIAEWIDTDNSKDETALCPLCGIDSVIGDKSGLPVTDAIFLNDMNSLYFT